MSQHLATCKEQRQPPTQPRKRLLTWIKASKEDHPELTELQPGTWNQICPVRVGCSNYFLFSAAGTTPHSYCRSGAERPPRSPPFWSVPSTKKINAGDAFWGQPGCGFSRCSQRNSTQPPSSRLPILFYSKHSLLTSLSALLVNLKV